MQRFEHALPLGSRYASRTGRTAAQTCCCFRRKRQNDEGLLICFKNACKFIFQSSCKEDRHNVSIYAIIFV